MNNISTYFKLNKSQYNLDFIDVKLDDDNELFIDPRLIELNTKGDFTAFKRVLRVYSFNLIKMCEYVYNKYLYQLSFNLIRVIHLYHNDLLIRFRVSKKS